MNAANNPAPFKLIFDWTEHRDIPNLLLPAFFLLSILIHAASFYLFQIAYPPEVLLRPPAARVQILDPQSTENWRLALWLKAQDPSLIAFYVQPEATRQNSLAPIVPYQPTYASAAPTPISPHITTATCSLPPALDLGPVQTMPRNPSPATTTTPHAANARLSSRLTFSSPLATRWTQATTPLASFDVTGQNLKNSVFHIAVTPYGHVLHVFCESSSGDTQIDNRVIDHLKQLIFAPTSTPTLQWGTATLFWGNPTETTSVPKAS